jgi:hypothetical protein
MTMPWGVVASILNTVLCGARPLGVHLPGIANEVARGMRSGEIGPFVVG